MNNLDKQYTDLLQDILDNGVKKQDRTGTGTLSVFGRQIRHKMSDGFPLLTTKKMPFKTITTELLWFLRGDTNIKYLVDNDCHIWDGDAYKNYFNKTKDLTKDNFEVKGNGVIIIKGFDLKSINQYGAISGTISDSYFRPFTQEEFINKIKTDDEFAKKWGDLGPVYGKQWRSWENFFYDCPNPDGDGFRHQSIDQIANLIRDLKTNPDSRRLIVSAWNVAELDSMTLPPCHYGFQVYTRELSEEERNEIRDMQYFRNNLHKSLKGSDTKIDWENIPTRSISLMWNQRSVDTFLGLPFNIASYGLLLEIIAKEVNMVPDELIGNLGDTHLYLNHIEQAKEQIGRELSLEERTEILKDRSDFKRDFYDRNSKLIIESEAVLNESQIPTRTREPYPLPTLVINDEFWNPNADLLSNLPHIQVSDFYVDHYQSHLKIVAPLSN